MWKNYPLHFAKRCLFGRNCGPSILLLSLVVSISVNYFFSSFILSRYASCGQDDEGECPKCSSQLFSDLSLSIDDLKSLQVHLKSDVLQKEAFIKDLDETISKLQSKVLTLQQSTAEEESELLLAEQKVAVVKEKLKSLEANFTPQLLPPLKAFFSKVESVAFSQSPQQDCSLLNCFDWSRCPLFFSLSVSFAGETERRQLGAYQSVLKESEACIIVVTSSDHLQQNAASENLIFLGNQKMTTNQRVMIASPVFDQFRHNFDIYLPSLSHCGSYDAQILPVKRKFVFTTFDPAKIGDDQLLSKAVAVLKTLNATIGDSIFHAKSSDECIDLRQSTFAILFHDFSNEFSHSLTQILRQGCIPVILHSTASYSLPFDDVIDWSKIGILLPAHRATEVYYLLRSISVQDLTMFKLEGRRVYAQFFRDRDSILLGILATMTKRLHLPPPALPDYVAESVYAPARYAPVMPMQPAPFAEDGVEIALDDVLGPVEDAQPSEKYVRNYTSSENWFYSVPNFPRSQQPFPHDVALKDYSETLLDFRPVGAGMGGSGKQLAMALGGNRPAEQFTIVLLTQGGDRLSILMDIISRFRDLPYLNKVVVVWNDRNSSSVPLNVKWPQLKVPIFVAKMSSNSLNNRFLPLSEIETDAVLSLDDDMFLRPDEIVFAFRVWRENRDRLVGFPSRSHGWNVSNWVYISDYSCEYSLILTGAAFLHKYYFYEYSYVMPAAIRQTVDELVNCEDIAMNFLVSHLTRQPPLKVTVRWTFHCPSCQSTLSKEQAHYDERSACLQRFAAIYGYMPLLFSQARADSVLFKTRVPSTHQKCFKFV